jgi:hypothetical protein
MLATTSNADVERAIAAFGAPSMPYRTFRVEPATPNAAAQSKSTAVAFPLLAAALPETAGVPAPAPLPATVTATPVVDTPSPPWGAEIWPLPAATSLQPEPAAPIPGRPGAGLARYRGQTGTTRTGGTQHAARLGVPHVARRTDPTRQAAGAAARLVAGCIPTSLIMSEPSCRRSSNSLTGPAGPVTQCDAWL